MIGIKPLALPEASSGENGAGSQNFRAGGSPRKSLVWSEIVPGVSLRAAVFSGVLGIVAAMGVFVLKGELA